MGEPRHAVALRSSISGVANYPEQARPSSHPAGHSGLRASDADRERVVEVLRQAAGDGRLSIDELDERISAVYAAKTYAELEPVIRDLPVSGPASGTTAIPSVSVPAKAHTSHLAVGILGGFERRGAWAVPANFTAVAIMGGGTVDLRDAQFTTGQVTISALAIMGGVEIIVPDDAEVHSTGIGIMGGFGGRARGPGRPDGPKIIVRGFALMGGVDVKRKKRSGKRAGGSAGHAISMGDDGPRAISGDG